MAHHACAGAHSCVNLEVCAAVAMAEAAAKANSGVLAIRTQSATLRLHDDFQLAVCFSIGGATARTKAFRAGDAGALCLPCCCVLCSRTVLEVSLRVCASALPSAVGDGPGTGLTAGRVAGLC